MSETSYSTLSGDRPGRGASGGQTAYDQLDRGTYSEQGSAATDASTANSNRTTGYSVSSSYEAPNIYEGPSTYANPMPITLTPVASYDTLSSNRTASASSAPSTYSQLHGDTRDPTSPRRIDASNSTSDTDAHAYSTLARSTYDTLERDRDDIVNDSVPSNTGYTPYMLAQPTQAKVPATDAYAYSAQPLSAAEYGQTRALAQYELPTSPVADVYSKPVRNSNPSHLYEFADPDNLPDSPQPQPEQSSKPPSQPVTLEATNPLYAEADPTRSRSSSLAPLQPPPTSSSIYGANSATVTEPTL